MKQKASETAQVPMGAIPQVRLLGSGHIFIRHLKALWRFIFHLTLRKDLAFDSATCNLWLVLPIGAIYHLAPANSWLVLLGTILSGVLQLVGSKRLSTIDTGLSTSWLIARCVRLPQAIREVFCMDWGDRPRHWYLNHSLWSVPWQRDK